MAINDERCDPPLERSEVEAIARSAIDEPRSGTSSTTPAMPGGSRTSITDAVRFQVDAERWHIWDHDLLGAQHDARIYHLNRCRHCR